jgi:hypothetical protein
MTTIDQHTITALVAHYKNCDDQTRGILLTDCKVHAMMHTDPHKRKIAAALYPELMRVENELSAPKRNAERENPVVAPAQIRPAFAYNWRPIARIFGGVAGLVSGCYILAAAVAGIAESVRLLFAAYGYLIVPAAFLLLLIPALIYGVRASLSERPKQSGEHHYHYYYQNNYSGNGNQENQGRAQG